MFFIGNLTQFFNNLGSEDSNFELPEVGESTKIVYLDNYGYRRQATIEAYKDKDDNETYDNGKAIPSNIFEACRKLTNKEKEFEIKQLITNSFQ